MLSDLWQEASLPLQLQVQGENKVDWITHLPGLDSRADPVVAVCYCSRHHQPAPGWRQVQDQQQAPGWCRRYSRYMCTQATCHACCADKAARHYLQVHCSCIWHPMDAAQYRFNRRLLGTPSKTLQAFQSDPGTEPSQLSTQHSRRKQVHQQMADNLMNSNTRCCQPTTRHPAAAAHLVPNLIQRLGPATPSLLT